MGQKLMAAPLWGGGWEWGGGQSKSGEGLMALCVFSFMCMFQIKCLRGCLYLLPPRGRRWPRHGCQERSKVRTKPPLNSGRGNGRGKEKRFDSPFLSFFSTQGTAHRL